MIKRFRPLDLENSRKTVIIAKRACPRNIFKSTIKRVDKKDEHHTIRLIHEDGIIRIKY